MNSLSYLSRQFDVLASPRTPPSTPVLENAPLLPDTDDEHSGSLKRVQTWSSKSFAFTASATSSAPWNLKRSYSSPAEVNQQGEPSSSTIPPPAPRHVPTPSSSRTSSRRPSVSSYERGLRPKIRPESILHRVFFIRVLFSLWHYLCSLWQSITRKVDHRDSHAALPEELSDDDEKDTEDEGKDEKSVSMNAQPPPPVPPPLFPGITVLPPLIRMNTDSSLDQTGAPPHMDPSLTALSPGTSSLHPSETSRTSTSTPQAARKTPLHLPKTLVLDLDETLIHSTSRPMPFSPGSGFLSYFGFGRRDKGAGHTVEVVLGGRSTLYHVYKRPFVDYFLRKVSTWYTLVIFTASMQEYADPVIDWLDAGRGILGRRFFRESCTQLPNGSYTKDLSVIEQDLSRVCLVDNSPICYNINEANGIPIEGWTNDPHDEALLDLLPVLDSLRFTSDVRRVLGIRGFS